MSMVITTLHFGRAKYKKYLLLFVEYIFIKDGLNIWFFVYAFLCFDVQHLYSCFSVIYQHHFAANIIGIYHWSIQIQYLSLVKSNMFWPMRMRVGCEVASVICHTLSIVSLAFLWDTCINSSCLNNNGLNKYSFQITIYFLKILKQIRNTYFRASLNKMSKKFRFWWFILSYHMWKNILIWTNPFSFR